MQVVVTLLKQIGAVIGLAKEDVLSNCSILAFSL